MHNLNLFIPQIYSEYEWVIHVDCTEVASSQIYNIQSVSLQVTEQKKEFTDLRQAPRYSDLPFELRGELV